MKQPIMKKILAILAMLFVLCALSACVEEVPVGPGPGPGGAVWVPGHYGPYGRWWPGHWAYN